MSDQKPSFGQAAAKTAWGGAKDVAWFVLMLGLVLLGNLVFYIWHINEFWFQPSDRIPPLFAEYLGSNIFFAQVLPILLLILVILFSCWILWGNLVGALIRRTLLLGTDYILPPLEKPLLSALQPFIHGNKVPGSELLMRGITHQIPRRLSRVTHWILGNLDIVGLLQQLRTNETMHHQQILHRHLKTYLDENYLEVDSFLFMFAVGINIGLGIGLVYVY